MGNQIRARLWLLPILLGGAFLRLYGLNNLSPPGLAHDEVANWLIDRAILAGNHTVYFTEAYGHEAGFHYVQAAFVGLLGDNALALRLPAAFSGLLLVAVAYVLARRLSGLRIALISAGLLAVLFWPVFYSRLALRAISLPLLSGLSAYFWWRGWDTEGRDRRLGLRRSSPTASARPPTSTPPHATAYLALAGLFAGLSLHTYMAARVVPIFYLLFLAILALRDRAQVRARWRQILLFWLVLLLVAAPLIAFLLSHPGAEYRIGEVDAPLRALLAGDARPVVDNFVDIIGMFGFRGDPLWRQNVAPEPVFDPLLAAFFYACLGVCLVYVGNIRHLFLILWAFTATIPSIVTIDAPSSIRIINILPILTLLPAILIHNLGHLSTKIEHLSTTPVDKWGVPLLVILLFFLHAGRTAGAVFVTWPEHQEVRFVWQEALTDIAAYLDGLPDASAVAIGGWTPHSMDPPTMELALRRDDLRLRFFDPRQSLLIPSPPPGEETRVFRPTILPLDRALLDALPAAVYTVREEGSFTQYLFHNALDLQPRIPAGKVFAGEMRFLGYTPGSGCAEAGDGRTCQIVTYWRVLQPPGGARQIFLHALGEEDTVVANGDALGAPAAFWQSGDLLLQRHDLALTHLAPYTLQLGVYDPRTGERLPTQDLSDSVLLSGNGLE